MQIDLLKWKKELVESWVLDEMMFKIKIKKNVSKSAQDKKKVQIVRPQQRSPKKPTRV